MTELSNCPLQLPNAPAACQQLLELLLNHAQGVVLLLGAHLELLRWNHHATALLDLTIQQKGTPLQNLSHPLATMLGHQMPRQPARQLHDGYILLPGDAGTMKYRYELHPLELATGVAHWLLLLHPATGAAQQAALVALHQLSLEGAEQGTWDLDLLTGSVVYNTRWAQMRGYALAAIAPDIESFWQTLHPDDRPLVEAALARYNEDAVPFYEAEFRVLTCTGNLIWVHSRGKVYQHTPEGKPARMAGVEMVVTQRKEAELALRANEQKLQTILNTLPDCVLIVSPDGRILEMNPAGLQLTGVASVAELENQPLCQWVLPAYRRQLMHQHHQALGGVQGSLECEITDCKGNHKWIHAACIPHYDAHHHIAGAVYISRDITEQKLHFQQIQHLNNELAFLNRHLQQVQEKERKHIVQEVLEEIGQLLATLKMDLVHARICCDQAQQQNRMASASRQVEVLVKAVRKLSAELHPVVLRDLGLEAALSRLCTTCEQEQGLLVELFCPQNLPPMSEVLQLMLYRSCELALRNVAHHPGASHVVLKCRCNGTAPISFWIVDNGASPPQPNCFLDNPRLLTIRENIRDFKGSFRFNTGLHRGNFLKFTLPL